MPLKSVVRTLNAYSIHGHVNPGADAEDVIDYRDFFRSLLRVELTRARLDVTGGDRVALTARMTRENRIALQFVSGNTNEAMLVYDEATGQSSEVDPGNGRMLVSGAWAIIDPEERFLVLERRRPGVPVALLERFLSKFGREELGMEGLTISLNPIANDSFAKEIERFTRIREASITLRRPNHSWTENAEMMLGDIPESNGADVEIQVRADRGQSLEKGKGIVREVINLARRPIGPLANATVVGTRDDYEGERTLSLRRNVVKGSARIPSDASENDRLDAIDKSAEGMIARISDDEQEEDIDE